MVIFSYEAEVTTSIPPAKMFKAFVIDGAKIALETFPDFLKSITIEGDGGPGTIKEVHFTDYKEKLIYGYTATGGDTVTYKVKFVPNDDSSSSGGGSIAKTSRTYYTKGDTVIKEEFIKEGNDRALVMFKAVEAYLTEHPDA
ncbi:unnamed protein product [Linum tenue]|uniref:Bet v I/Major latex protein domain-containing protein n=1 Tax=Linum tenue TaxID=586396 RepID=A0AAV0P8M1_9ROSI|nr:unnamed protein product [Linum tenue]